MVTYRMSTDEKPINVECEIADGCLVLYLDGKIILTLTEEGKLARSINTLPGIEHDSKGRIALDEPIIEQGTPLMALLNVAKEMFTVMSDHRGNRDHLTEIFSKNCTIWTDALCEAERLTT